MPDNQPFQILLDPKSNQAENHAQFRRPSSGAGPNSPKSCLREGDAPASIAPLPLTVLPASIHSTEAKTPDTETRLSALPSRAPGPAPEPQPEPRAEEQKSSRSGRKAFLVIALVAALALGTFLIDRFVMPKVHYQEAMRLMAEGKYDRALAIFAAMEDYQDSKDRIVQCKDGKARTLMCEGKYQQALDLLEAEIGDSPLIADCLYALGVTAYNERDPQTALQYTRQLRTRFPDYEKTEELEQFCNYSMGALYVERAAAVDYPYQKSGFYEKAVNYFEAAGGYGDSEIWIAECRYQYACGLRSASQSTDSLPISISIFGELGDYRDSSAKRLDLMFEYVMKNYIDQHDNFYYLNKSNQTVFSYLDELIEHNYDGARELLDRLNGVGFSLELTYGRKNDPLPAAVTDLSEITLHYEIPSVKNQTPVQAYILCVYPDERAELVMLSEGGGSGSVRLGEFGWDTCDADGQITLALFDGYTYLPPHLLDAEGNFNAAALKPTRYISFRYVGD